MTTPDEATRLQEAARHYEPDPVLDRALSLFETDRVAFNRLPQQVKSHAAIYVDFRQSYRDAVKAGVIPDDRGPSAA